MSVSVAVKAGRAGNRTEVVGEPDAALSETGLEGVDVGEGLVGGDLTQQRPEALGRVKFWRIGRQEHEPKVVRHGELRRAVLGSAVEDKKSDDVYGQ